MNCITLRKNKAFYHFSNHQVCMCVCVRVAESLDEWLFTLGLIENLKYIIVPLFLLHNTIKVHVLRVKQSASDWRKETFGITRRSCSMSVNTLTFVLSRTCGGCNNSNVLFTTWWHTSHAFYNHSLFLHELLSFGQPLKGLLVWNVVQFLHTLPWGCPERHCQLFTGVSWCSFTCLVLYNIWKCYSEEEWIQFLDLWTFCINILAPLQRIEENTPSFVGKLQNSSS